MTEVHGLRKWGFLSTCSFPGGRQEADQISWIRWLGLGSLMDALNTFLVGYLISYQFKLTRHILLKMCHLYKLNCPWLHWLPECIPSVQALHKSLHQIHTSSHPSTTQDSHKFFFISPFFFHMLQRFGILCHSLLCHLIILGIVLYLYKLGNCIISLCYFMYPLHIMHKVSLKCIYVYMQKAFISVCWLLQ